MATEKALHDEIDRLTKLLANNEEQLALAAQIGQQLLTDNEETETRFEKLRIESNQRIEELEQENHILNLRNQTIKCKYEDLANDMDILKGRHDEDVAKKCQELNEEFKKQMSKITRQSETAAEEADRYRTLVSQLNEKVEVLQKMVTEERNHNQEELTTNDDNSELLEELQLNLAKAVEINKDMELENVDLRHDKDCLNLKLESAGKEVKSLQEYQEIIETEVDTWRTKYNDIRIELASAREQLMDYQSNSNYQSNPSKSLFSEVEDQRIQLEGSYKCLKVRFDTLEKQYNDCRQQMQQLKSRYSSLLAMGSFKADEAKMKNLEQNLSQSEADRRTLSIKVQELEEQLQAVTNSNIEHAKCLESVNLSEKDYIDFLRRDLKEYKSKFCKLSKEIESLRLMNASESQKLRQTEYSLSEAQKIADKLKVDNLRIRSKLEEEIIKRKKLQYELDVKREQNSKKVGNNDGKSSQQKENHHNNINSDIEQANLMKATGKNYRKDLLETKQPVTKHVKFAETTTIHYQPLQEVNDESINTSNVDDSDPGNLQRDIRNKPKRNIIHVPAIDDNPNNCKQQ
ncbi:Protein Spindly [Trichoplax sp. H2]|nr:Protein Spindly [Trichoplax sp. H2]|eukprot:RDD40718.1 Protein Spindly [Trichoplax sp. H2]